MPVGEALIGATTATKVTALNPSLFQSGLFAKVIIGALVSLFVSVSTVCTVGVVVWRANYRSPGPVNDYYETWKNTAVEMSVLKNDRAEAGGAPGDEGDKNTLKLVSLTSPLHGVAVIMDSKKHVKYTPFNTYAGMDTFQYIVTNGKKDATGNVTIKIKNHAPDPVDDTFELQKKINASLDVLANDKDIDEGDQLRIVSCTGIFENSELGTTTVSQDGKFIIFSNNKYPASGSFAYTVTDGNDTATATVFITVVNSPPVAEPDEFSVNRSTPTDLNVLLNDHDPNGDQIQIISAGNQDFGHITFTPSFVTYTPKFNSSSSDSFDYVIWDGAYDVDGNKFTSTANVLVRIRNPDPVAPDQEFTFSKNTAFNPINLSNHSYSFVPNVTVTMSVVTEPQFGTFILDLQSEEVEFTYLEQSHTFTKNNYTVLYTPVHDFVGDDELQYQITDDWGMTATGTIKIHVINNPPAPVDDSVEVGRNSHNGINIYVLNNDVDPDGDNVVLNTAFSLQPSHGRATYSGLAINYIPTAGYFGDDEFQYSVYDESPNSQTSYAMVHVHIRNDAPQPQEDWFVVPKNVAKNLNVLENDVDPNQDLLTIVPFTDDSTSYGEKTVESSSNPNFIRYTPKPNQIYAERFSYTVSDGDSSFAQTAWVNVNVTNTPPTPVGETITSHWFNNFTLDIVANDIDENGDSLAVDSLWVSSIKYTTCEQLDEHNVFVTVDYGGYRYDYDPITQPAPAAATAEVEQQQKVQKRGPDSSIVGTDFVLYTITDGQAPGTKTGQLKIIVMNSKPVAVADEITVHVNIPTKFPAGFFLANDYDDDPQDQIRMAGVILYPPYFGTVSFDGVDVTFTADHPGTTSFVYRLTDGCSMGDDTQGIVTVHVINDPPVAVDDRFFFGANPEPTTHDIFVVGNDIDPEFPGSRVKIVPESVAATSAQGFALSVETDFFATVGLTVPGGWTGNDSFTYQVTDGFDLSNVATCYISIVEGKPPQAIPDVFQIHWREVDRYQNVLSNDKPGNFSIEVSEVIPGPYTLSIAVSPDRQGIIYTPKHDIVQFGTNDMLKYRITDGVFTMTTNVQAQVVDQYPVCHDDYAAPVHWRSNPSAVNARANDTDPDGDDLFITRVNPAKFAYGTPSLGADQASVSFVFNSNIDYGSVAIPVGNLYQISDSVPYIVSDTKLTAECFVHFYSYDRTPVAVDDNFSFNKNSENVVLNVLANDFDPDTADIPFLTIVSATAQQGIGSILSFNPLKVNLIKGFSGNAILKYRITDGKLRSEEATVTIQVVNRAPVCTSPSFQIPKSYGHSHTSSIFDLVGLACTDADGDSIELSTVGLSGIGSTGISNNKATFVPTENHSGQTTISFSVTDRQDSASSTFTVSIVNNAPVATALTETFSRNQFQFKEYTPSFSDPDNDLVSVTGIAPAPGSGGVQVGPTRVNFTTIGYVDLVDGNKLRFTQKLSGVLSVVYTVTDSDVENPLTASATATVTVTGNPPIARDDSYVVSQGVSMDLYVMSNDTDPDGDAIWIDPTDWLVGTPPTPITPVLMTDGSGVQFFRFDASTAPSHCKSMSFQYKIKSIDGFGVGTVSIKFTNCVCKFPLDIVYDVDSSGSIGSYEFKNRVRPFLADITNQLDIGAGDLQIRVGIVQFGTKAYKETSSLLTYTRGTSKKPGVLDVIEDMSYRKGNTNTKGGLSYSQDLLEAGRAGVKKLIIVLTDGEYNTGGDPASKAKEIYNTPNWRILAIAVGQFDQGEIKRLVKNPETDYFEVSNFDALNTALQSVITAACDS